MEVSRSKIKKFVIFEEVELLSPTSEIQKPALKKFLIFSLKNVFLIFGKTELSYGATKLHTKVIFVCATKTGENMF